MYNISETYTEGRAKNDQEKINNGKKHLKNETPNPKTFLRPPQTTSHLST